MGLWSTAVKAGPRQAARVLDAALLTLLGGLVGARIVFVLLEMGYFHDHLAEVFMLWQGGLSWMGAVAGGLLALIVLALVQHRSLARLADQVAPLVLPLTLTAWLGCWMAGIAYGASVPWGLPMVDESGSIARRVPVQLLAALSLLIYGAWLERRRTRLERSGVRATLAGMGLSLNLLIFSLLRADPAPHWLGQRLDFWVALALLVVCSASWLAARFPFTKRYSTRPLMTHESNPRSGSN